MEPTFSLVYTSVRPDRIPLVVDEWACKSKLKDFEVVITVDANDPKSKEAADRVTDRHPNVSVYVQESEPFNCVKGWNLAAEKAVGRVIVQLTDDFSPPPEWDQRLLELAPADWINGEYAVHVNDAYVRDLMTLAIVTRKRYARFGYLFYPGYESIFCDTELTEVAYRDGVVIQAMHLIFEHKHPDCFKRQRDQVDLKHASKERWNTGELLYNFRKARNFPLDEGPNAQVVPKSPKEAKKLPYGGRSYCAYLQVTRDDFCLHEVCTRLHEEGVTHFFYAVPSQYWDGRPTPAEDLAQVNSIAERLRVERGLSVDVRLFDVEDYRYPGDTRIDTETRLRNDSLEWIRGAGFEHILIVDGDELWTVGTLNRVDQLVARGFGVVSCGMIPVVGLPGYPVDRATDLAVVYIGGKLQFKACRTPFVEQKVIREALIYHFTGTRRTMDEIIAKHRTSGHYDDPDYDFEGWIANTLPNIKPGFQNAHMYKKFQIWPVVRSWFPEEKQKIPASLHPFLGL